MIHLTKTKKNTEAGGLYDSSSALGDTDRRISCNLQQFAKATESFHASASRIVRERPEVTKMEPMWITPTRQEAKNLRCWVPGTRDWDEDSTQCKSKSISYIIYQYIHLRVLARQLNNQAQKGDKLVPSHAPVSAKEYLELALTSLKCEKFAKAEEFLRKSLNYAGKEATIQDTRSIRLVLACVCGILEKWGEVENVLVPWLEMNDLDEILKLDILALLYYHQRNYNSAIESCSQAIGHKWRIYGRESTARFHSISFISEIYRAKGDSASVAIWLSLLPLSHKKESPIGLWDSAISDALNSEFRMITRRYENFKPSQLVDRSAIRSDIEPLESRVDHISISEVPYNRREDKQKMSANRSLGYTKFKQRKSGQAKLAERLLIAISRPQSEVEMLPALDFELECESLATSIVTLDNSSLLHHTLKGQSGHIYNAVFSPDGRLMLPGSNDCNSWLWNTKSGLVICSLHGYTRSVRSMAFLPNGQIIETDPRDHPAKLWNMEMGKLYYILKDHTDTIWSIGFSPDGNFVATGSDRIVRLWNMETGQLLHTLEGHLGTVWSVTFSHDGKRLATGSQDHTAGVWDVRTGRLCYMLKGHIGCVWRVTFSPDGRLLATGSHDHTAKLWDAKRGYLRYVLNSHSGSIQSVAFSSNGRFLATGSHDHTAKMWDAETGHLFHTIHGIPNPIRSVDFSPDGRLLATGSDECASKEWDAGTGKLCCGDGTDKLYL